MISYPRRILLFSLSLALATALVIWQGPQIEPVRVVAQGPAGDAVPAASSIQVTFSQEMDRRSVEQRFSLQPPAPGRIAWRGPTLTFYPDGLLRPSTSYTVTFEAGLRDQRGRTSPEPVRWSFRTRAPGLVFVAGPAGQGTRVVVNWPAEPPQLLVEDSNGIGAISLSSAGNRLLYTLQRGPNHWALWLLDLDGGQPQPLVDEDDASIDGPAWSPDGALIAFERRSRTSATEPPGLPRLWLAQPDGTTLGPVEGGTAVNRAPAWSPDGLRLAFVDAEAGVQAVYDFASRRSEFPGSAGEAATWSPDSTMFVYVASSPADGVPLLRRALIASGETQPIPGTEGAGSPAWSPDGRWIAFTRRGEGSATSIWVIPAAGGEPRQISAAAGSQDIQPAWSPDSTTLAFTRRTPGQNDPAVYLVTLAGEERLIASAASSPAWLP